MTADARFSMGWALLSEDALPSRIAEALAEVRRCVDGATIVVRTFNNAHLALCFDIAVDLPARGPVGGIDIRGHEPISLVFHRHDYPTKAPFALSDRRDLPTARLPHLNTTSPGQPPSLCLHRGNIDDWFAEHSLADFIERVQAWFRDAARGRLMREGDHFEHTRPTNPLGYAIFDVDMMDARVRDAWSAHEGEAGWEFVVMNLSTKTLEHAGWETGITVQVDWFSPPSEKLLDLVRRWNELVGASGEKPKMVIGIVCRPPRSACDRYFGSLPTTYGELVAFAAELGIDLRAAVAEYRDAGAHKLAGIPISIAILRPRPLIGRQSPIEWLSFIVIASADAADQAGSPHDTASAYFVAHRDPLTPTFARTMSRASPDPAATGLLGCGALGSKIALHMARAGAPPVLLVDPASLTPHHLVRHGLGPAHIGKNKAAALRNEIVSMFGHGGEKVSVESVEASAFDVLRDESKLATIGVLVDVTASSAVLNALVAAEHLPQIVVARGEIADAGRLGILSIEGDARNPRLDDLQVHTLDLARRDGRLSSWLERHRADVEEDRGPALEEIGLGVGCSSTTMRLADEVVALHAANFAASLKGTLRGTVLLVHADLEEAFGSNTQRLFIPPVTVVDASGECGWTVRLGARALDAMRGQLRGRAERGGLLIGLIHKKRRIVYVTDALMPSRDSRGSEYEFVRGVSGYSERVSDIEARTGNLLGYVGEWHTHPVGPADPSPRDLASAREIAASLRPAGLPAHVMVVSPRGVRSHVEF